LVEQKVFDHKSYEVALVIFDVFLILKDFWKLFIEDGHTEWKNIQILVEVIIGLVIFILIELFCSTMVVFRVEVESVHAGQHFVVLIHCCVIVTLVKILTISKH